VGIKLKDQVDPVKKVITFDDLRGQKIGIDTYNYLYGALYATKGPGGQPLQFNNRVTSHVSFFFHKTMQMLELGIKPVYIFDGEKHFLKFETMAERREAREAMKERAEQARKDGDLDLYYKLSTETQSVEAYMIDDLKELFTTFGVPWVQAKSEGEAQSAYMCAKGDLYGTASQDYDSLLFGSKVFLRNIYRGEKMHIRGKEIKLDKERIFLSDVLENIGITREQLIDVAILAGTDFNQGIEHIGVKTALKHIKKYDNIEGVIDNLTNVRECITLSFANQVREIFLHPRVEPDYSLRFKMPEFDKLSHLLVTKFGFAQNQVQSKLFSLHKNLEARRVTVARL